MADRRSPTLRAPLRPPRRWIVLEAVGALLAAVCVTLQIGWTEPLLAPGLLRSGQVAGLGLYALALLIAVIREKNPWGRVLLGRRFEVAVLLGAALLAWWPPSLGIAATALLIRLLLIGYLWLAQTALPTGMIFIGSFVSLVVVGTAALQLPAATPPDQPISLIDSVFTITSAISQTGLVVRPTGEGFTRLGHIIILIWIQVGALGVLVFGALIATVVGSSFSVRATQTLAESTEQGWTGQLSLRRLVVFIIVFTHVAEAIGAAVFYFGWPEDWTGAPAMASTGDRIFHSVFFAVSSFCNAGFVTTVDSLEGLRAHWTSHISVAGLIVLGSIGFPVLDNIRKVIVARVRRVRLEGASLVRLNLNTKVVLVTTLSVYLLGFVTIILGELTQADQPLGVAALDAHFMTINRTAGFATIAPDEMGLLSQLTLILMMFIGGSPLSVAGGIKIMVFAILALTVWATITGKPHVEAFGRTIPDALVRKSATLIVLYLAAVMAVGGVLAATETGEHGQSLDALLFETVSAFGTCGLSLGITPDLSLPGKIAISVAMFVGRVGPLAALAALVAAARVRRPRYHYPTEDVVVY